jgi:hypothetical protein
MRRRDFITGIAGSAAAWPLAARAQQGERMRRIGVLTAYSESDPEAQARVGAFREGLQKSAFGALRKSADDRQEPATTPGVIVDTYPPAFLGPCGKSLTVFRAETASKHCSPSPILAKRRNLRNLGSI